MESAKECVTTQRPNELALKMDGAQACYLYFAVRGSDNCPLTSRQAWRFYSGEACGVTRR